MKIVQLAAVDVAFETQLVRLNEECKLKGYEVHCISSPGKYSGKLEGMGYFFHPVKIDRKISPVKNVKSILDIAKILKKVKPDIVHVHSPIASVLGRIAAKLAGVPVVIYTAHGFYFHEGMSSKKYKLFYNIEKYVGKIFTDYIFTQSVEDFEVAKNGKFLSNKNRNNYLHISNGIDIDNIFNYAKINEKNIVDLKNKYKINDDDKIITFIGRLVQEKGILDLLEGFEKVESSNAKLVIIGETFEHERDLKTKETLNKYIDNNNIIFTGKLSSVKIAEILYLSDIFCLPSYREGMPRSIIEAMTMKNAIIATNIRGSREEVIHNETGYLIDTHSPNQITESINKLLNDSELLNKFKEKGYQRALELYDETKVVEKELEIFSRYE